MKNIAVIFGGKSTEHDVSILTGIQTICAINKQKFNVIPVYIDKQNLWYTGKIANVQDVKAGKLNRATFICGDGTLYSINGSKLKKIAPIDVAVNCCHGGLGERGELSGALSVFNVAHTAPDIYSAFLTMDKEQTKKKIKQMRLSQTDFVCIKKNYTELPKIMYPAIVKPNQGGSSIGISVANSEDELIEALKLAHLFGEKAIVENCLQDFIEVNCAIVKLSSETLISQLEYPKHKSKFLSFEDKYKNFQKGGKFIKLNQKTEQPPISEQICEKISQISKKLYQEFNLFGICRIDFMVKDEKIYVNELNSIPGSLANFLFKHRFSFDILLEKIIEVAVMRKEEEKAFIQHFDGKLFEKNLK